MFLTRMVSGLICSKNSNKNVNASNPHPPQSLAQAQSQTHHQQTKSPKPNKKTEKCKRSLSKTDSKKSISELLRSQIKEAPTQAANATVNLSKEMPSTSKASGSSSSNCAAAALKPPTKVKSGSWKRSEKQISSYNTISGKKSKSLRKRSPTWLKFPNSPVKIAEKVSYVSPADSTSVCRPGTLYSDVLFGAGSSCLVKIKTLTPRRSSNTAQKKLTKALLKCASNDGETDTAASGSEPETDRELFPSLSEFNKSPTPTDGENAKVATTTESGGDNLPPPAFALPKCDGDVDDGEADVVILSETNGVQNAENGFSDISYGSYLEQHFKQLNGGGGGGGNNSGAELTQKPSSTKPFTIDIPQWNFLDADVSTDAYPKFLCQFEDEHYLKAEKMALLGLKLALGNNSQQGKFKF